jgi:cytochrome c
MIVKGLLLFLVILIVACSSSKKSNRHVIMNISQSDTITGMTAIFKNDCIVCHKLDEKLTGPSFLSVANKYDLTERNIVKLATKIQKGGTGKWGEIPMLPHPGVSMEEARQMVKYILSLKNK